jgi:hypothetical protein
VGSSTSAAAIDEAARTMSAENFMILNFFRLDLLLEDELC